MIQKMTLTATVLAFALAGCGGGGDDGGSNTTGSDSQVRLIVAPETATGWVQTAIATGLDITRHTRYLQLFAPQTTGNQDPATKEVGFLRCTYVLRDPACTGDVRVETEFPLDAAQAEFANRSTLSFQWNNITGIDGAGASPINSIETLRFSSEFPSTSPFNGTYRFNYTETTPLQYTRELDFGMSNLAVFVDPVTRRAEMSGFVSIFARQPLRSQFGESITFTNWSNFQDQQRVDASARLFSRDYLSGPSAQGITVDITIISSEIAGTEYRVFAQAEGNREGVTRTVKLTFDDQGRPVFSAS